MACRDQPVGEQSFALVKLTHQLGVNGEALGSGGRRVSDSEQSFARHARRGSGLVRNNLRDRHTLQFGHGNGAHLVEHVVAQHEAAATQGV